MITIKKRALFSLHTPAIAATLALAMSSQANETWPAPPELDNACKIKSKNTLHNETACRIYIHGYVEGAIVTDGIIVKKFENNFPERSDYFQRAYKTRVGNTSEPLPATYFADFCIEDNEKIERVVDKSIAALKSNAGQDKPVRLVVYEVLKTHYSCDNFTANQK